MPILKVKTAEAELVWSSPDGQRKIYNLTLDYEGKPVSAKTYSQIIATRDWEGEVETYEKQGRNGSETFVKQPPKEGGYTGPASTGTRNSGGSYQPKDEKAIQAMWAINGAIALMPEIAKGKTAKIEDIEADAQELYLMVERVKATPPETVQETEAKIDQLVAEQTLPGQISIEDLDKVFDLKGKEIKHDGEG